MLLGPGLFLLYLLHILQDQPLVLLVQLEDPALSQEQILVKA